jgi:photoactive yellow protein
MSGFHQPVGLVDVPATAGSEDLQGQVSALRQEVRDLRADVETLRADVERLRGPQSRPLSRPELDELPPEPVTETRQTGGERSPAEAPRRAPFNPPPLTQVAAASPQQGLDFGTIMQLTPDKLDSLPYGLITLDARGRVIYYNDTESRLVGLPKDRVIGRDFFRDVAPCTRLREFEGRFVELAANPTAVRVQSFDFVFKFARGEQFVSVVMTPARVRGQFHLALLRRARTP